MQEPCHKSVVNALKANTPGVWKSDVCRLVALQPVAGSPASLGPQVQGGWAGSSFGTLVDVGGGSRSVMRMRLYGFYWYACSFLWSAGRCQ